MCNALPYCTVFIFCCIPSKIQQCKALSGLHCTIYDNVATIRSFVQMSRKVLLGSSRGKASVLTEVFEDQMDALCV